MLKKCYKIHIGKNLHGSSRISPSLVKSVSFFFFYLFFPSFLVSIGHSESHSASSNHGCSSHPLLHLTALFPCIILMCCSTQTTNRVVLMLHDVAVEGEDYQVSVYIVFLSNIIFLWYRFSSYMCRFDWWHHLIKLK